MNTSKLKKIAFLGVLALVAGGVFSALLTQYSKAAANVNIQQGVVLRAYDSSNNMLAESDFDTPIDLTATVTAGDALTQFQVSGQNVNYFTIEYLASNPQVNAPVELVIELNNEASTYEGLFKEFLEYRIYFGTDKSTAPAIKIYENSGSPAVNGLNSVLCSGSGSSFTCDLDGDNTDTSDQFTVEVDTTNLKITLSGNYFTLKGDHTSVNFILEPVVNPATQPGTYTVNLYVNPR